MKLISRQKITIAVLAPFWIGLVIVSHIPIPQLVYRAEVSDKWLHFLAYLDLIFLVWFSISPDDKVNWKKRQVLLILFVVCAYGGIDELLQPYVGRIKDFGDFLANVAGVLTGLLLFTFLAFWQALLAVLAITIFGLTNLAKADLSKLVPILNAGFHIFAYAGITAVWIKFMRLYLPYKSFDKRLLLTCVVPVVFLTVVKIGSLLLGRHFSPTDLLFAAFGIIITALGKKYARKNNQPRITPEPVG
ncbi:MAG: VanZ family protein [Sedimentisphaerales bacterium]|nr:VanZ family protein [Sedimentisphaerales bacterium]